MHGVCLSARGTALALTFLAGAATLRAQPTPPRARLIEELRLDATKEDFSAVGRVFVGPRGQIAVPVRQDYHIRLFDSTGQRVATVGRRGAGPGEFESFAHGGWVADTLWIWDDTQRRSTYIAPDGKVLRTSTLPAVLAHDAPGAPVGRLEFFTPLGVLGEGTFVGDARYASARTSDSPTGQLRRIVRSARDGSLTEILTPARPDDSRWFMMAGGMGNRVPFAGTPQFVVAQDGSRVAVIETNVESRDGGTFTVTVHRSDGSRLFARQFPFIGIPIPKRAADSAVASFAGPVIDGPRGAQSAFQSLAREKMPPVYAPVEYIVAGADETTWIALRAAAEGQIAIMLSGRGDPVASVLLPPRSRLRQGSATRVWLTQADGDGLTSVVRYRIAR